jgi:hypothetical protein
LCNFTIRWEITLSAEIPLSAQLSLTQADKEIWRMKEISFFVCLSQFQLFVVVMFWNFLVIFLEVSVSQSLLIGLSLTKPSICCISISVFHIHRTGDPVEFIEQKRFQK